MSEGGKFITFEGGEGSGKTTQAKLLFEALNNNKIATIFTREPGGTDGAEAIRNLLVKGETGRWDRITETLLYFAARRDHVQKLIKPSLERGESVICDRFTDSTIAYQGYGHGVKTELINGLHKITLGEFKPHLTLVFDIDIEKGIGRAKAREKKSDGQKEDRYERMDSIFHKNVRRGFLEIAKNDSKRCVVINADGKINEIHNAVIFKVNLHLGTKISPLSPIAIDGVLRG